MQSINQTTESFVDVTVINNKSQSSCGSQSQSECGSTESLSYQLHFRHEDKTVVCSDQELKMLSASLHLEVHLQLQFNPQYLCHVWDTICVRIHCIKEELKCFAWITFAAFCSALQCIREAIHLGICWTLDAASELWCQLKLKVDCILAHLEETACHVLVELSAAFHWLKLKIFATWAKIKLAAYWTACKLRGICHSLKVKLNFKYHELKVAIKQMKCYLRSVFHRAVDKIHCAFAWVKSVLKAFACKIHRFKESILADCHRKCLEVLLPCMSADIIAKVSICHTEAQAVCRPLMWENFTIHPSLWTTSKKSNIEAVSQVFQWSEVTRHMKSVTVSCKGVSEEHVKTTSVAASFFFQKMAQSECGVKPYLVRFKDISIRAEWAATLRKVETVKRIQPKRCTFEETELDSETYSSFSIDYEELNSQTAFALLHQQVKSLTVRVKIGQKTSFQVSEDRFVTIKNRRVLELTREELRVDSELKVEVDKYYSKVIKNGHVQSIQHLERIKIEFVERTTKKVIRVTCPAHC